MALNGAIKAIFWAWISSWYYGYHLTELNFPVNSLTCWDSTHDGHPLLPPCLGLTSYMYSGVTAILTVGGLVGSLMSDRVVRSEGLAGGIAWTAWINLASALLMAAAPHWIVFALGRFVAGVACGLAVCFVPPYLATVARTTPQLAPRVGQIGTLHQLAVVLGICSSQVLGRILTGPNGDKLGGWRWVCAMSGMASIIQIAMTAQPEDFERSRPATSDPEDPEEADRPHAIPRDEIAAPLIQNSGGGPGTEQLSARDLLSNATLRRPAVLVITLMSLQQLSGVNAVLFYSTPVLQSIYPNAGAGAVSVFITVVNVLMTFPAIVLVDRVGRRPLLLTSSVSMLLMSLLLAYGLDDHLQKLSGFAIVAFIAAFAPGLGPVPWLLVSEMVPHHAVPALSSLALSASWITTGFVGLVFIPLRDALSYPVDPSDPMSAREGEGRVFYVFTVSLAITTLVIMRGVAK